MHGYSPVCIIFYVNLKYIHWDVFLKTNFLQDEDFDCIIVLQRSGFFKDLRKETVTQFDIIGKYIFFIRIWCDKKCCASLKNDVNNKTLFEKGILFKLLKLRKINGFVLAKSK